MTYRLFALVSAVSLAALTSSASAQGPLGSRALSRPYIAGSSTFYDGGGRNASCRNAFLCGVRAYDYDGPQSGIAWFRKAARKGSTPAMRSLGLIYLRGARGVPANPSEAAGWFYEAALRDDAQSMYALARVFEEGVGVERDPALARFWLERAAAKGDRQARRALAARQ
jgi:TPR repeat protein